MHWVGGTVSMPYRHRGADRVADEALGHPHRVTNRAAFGQLGGKWLRRTRTLSRGCCVWARGPPSGA